MNTAGQEGSREPREWAPPADTQVKRRV